MVCLGRGRGGTFCCRHQLKLAMKCNYLTYWLFGVFVIKGTFVEL